MMAEEIVASDKRLLEVEARRFDGVSPAVRLRLSLGPIVHADSPTASKFVITWVGKHDMSVDETEQLIALLEEALDELKA